MFFSRRKRRRQREEIAAHLTDVRDAAESSVRELSLCQAVLEIQAEQLEAAELTGRFTKKFRRAREGSAVPKSPLARAARRHSETITPGAPSVAPAEH